MGRHTATDGEPVHPVVAAALARRATDPVGTHRGSTSRDGELGWPDDPAPGGGGLGWPGDLVPARSAGPVPDDGQRPQESDEEPAEDPAPQLDATGRRRGWRRLLGARAA